MGFVSIQSLNDLCFLRLFLSNFIINQNKTLEKFPSVEDFATKIAELKKKKLKRLRNEKLPKSETIFPIKLNYANIPIHVEKVFF